MRSDSAMPPRNCQRARGVQLGVLVDLAVDGDQQASAVKRGQVFVQVAIAVQAAILFVHGVSWKKHCAQRKGMKVSTCRGAGSPASLAAFAMCSISAGVSPLSQR